MLTSDLVPLTQSALLVIDAQESFTVTPRWARRANPAFEANVASLVDAVIERTVFALRRRFARIVSAAVLVGELSALRTATSGEERAA